MGSRGESSSAPPVKAVIGIDTNILLRWLLDESLLPEDAIDQRVRVARLIQGSGEIFFVNHVVIAETIWVLKNRVGQSKSQIRRTIEHLLLSRNVRIDNKATVEAALKSYSERPGDFADHLIGRINADAGCKTTLTFDKAALKSPDFTEVRKG